jgi:hypothetical protein
MTDSEEGFLSRWSRRKRGVASEAEEAQAPLPPPAAMPTAPEPPAFDPASLPPLDSLTAASDFTAFLRAEVPAVLRQAALRRAWTLDPAIRNFTGPADYAWDYNAADGMAGFALELGGDVKKLLAQAIGMVEEAAPEPADQPAQVALAPPPEVPPAEAPPPEAPPAEALPSEALPAEPPPAAAAVPEQLRHPPPRRHGGAVPV